VTGQDKLLDQRWRGKSVRQAVKELAQLLALVCLFIAAFRIYFHAEPLWAMRYWMLAGAAVLLIGCRWPFALYHFWKAWMWLGDSLGHVVSFIVIFGIWALATVPIGLMLRIIGKRLMDVSFKSGQSSYWEERDPAGNDFKLLKKQY
jgi:hypothetical protein